MKTPERDVVLADWYATFTQLREQLLEEIGLEFDLATKHHPPIASLHEGYAIILEELDELKAEVWKNPKKHPDRQALARKEAIQVAAMALRLLHDVL